MVDLNKLENEENKTFFELNPSVDISDLTISNNFLYYNIMPPKEFEKLEIIFKEKKILSGKYLNNYFESYEYSYNSCNYVSLFGKSDHLNKYISLIISPFVDAINTIYIPLDDIINIKTNRVNLKNKYSAFPNEYQVKDSILISDVLAIGIPYCYLINTKGYCEAANLMNSIMILMLNYDIDLPILDTSNNNRILANSINLDKKVLKKSNNKS